MERFGAYVLAMVVALVAATGCADKLRNRDLERVAKDWSLVVRASQIMPVYPLTEDLQPGDIFLVQTPIEEQVRTYTARGFLPLDNMVRRIDPAGYGAFYARSFEAGVADRSPLPRHWLRPKDGAAWSSAPSASFPTYAFSARSGGGFSLALPVQGVPIGLSLLGGDSADGTVTIADVRTYGIDMVSLYDDVRRWANRNRAFLGNFASGDGRRNYLRVVSRVYLTGRVNIALQSARSLSGSASGGAPKPVDLVIPAAGKDPTAATAGSYASNIDALNRMIQSTPEKSAGGGDVLPGGTVKVVAVSGSSITLEETFPRPLVIGYLGFDVAIGPKGVLGPPAPTHAVLTEGRRPLIAEGGLVSLLSDAELSRAYALLAVIAPVDERAADLVRDLDRLTRHVPATYPCPILGLRDAGQPLSVIYEAGHPVYDGSATFSTLVTYRTTLLSSLADLRETQADPERLVSGFSGRTPDADKFLADSIRGNEDALARLNAELRKHEALLYRARSYASLVEE